MTKNIIGTSKSTQYKLFFWQSGLSLCCLSIIYAYCLFFRPFTFNFEPSYNDHYFILLFSVGVFGFNLIYTLINRDYTSSKTYDFLACILALGSAAFLIYTNDFANEHYVICLSLLLLSLSFRKYIRPRHVKIMLAFFFILYIIELFQALSQICNDNSGNVAMFAVGSLHNSGILSCYLIIHIPFLKHYLFDSKRKTPRIIFACFLLLTLLVLYYTQSRTALISLIIILAILAINENEKLFLKMKINQYGRRYIYLAIVALFIILISSLFFYKIQSSFGRLLILKIASKHFDDYFWTGVGFGKFTHYYPLWQIDYFKTITDYRNSECMNAGESYVAFNEFIQTFIELGFFRYLLIAGCLFDYFSSQSVLNGKILRVMKISMLAILICCLTSYSLHSIPILFAAFSLISFSYVIRDDKPLFDIIRDVKPLFKLKARYSINYCLKITLLLATSLLFLVTTGKCIAICSLNKIMSSTVSDQNKIKHLNHLYPALKDDDKFLVSYGELLSLNNSDCLTSARILKQALSIQLTYRGLESLSNSYKCKDDYKNLFYTNQTMAWFIPSRFRPKYRMVISLDKLRQHNSAKILAKEILDMPVKIPNEETSQIIEEMKTFLKQSAVMSPIGKKTDKK